VNFLQLSDRVPSEPGLYRMRPLPNEEEEINEYLFRVWGKGSTGLFIDEGYMVPDPRTHNGLKAVLTQGRALHIPVITLSQRPSGINRHCFSEADMFCSYHLNDKQDRERVAELVPEDEVWGDLKKQSLSRLPDFHSRWYDVGFNWSTVLAPCPSPEKILKRFKQRLEPKRETIDNPGQSGIGDHSLIKTIC
jgi:hypothetical protein